MCIRDRSYLPINETINHPSYQPTNQASSDQPTNQPTIHPTHQPINHHPTNQRTNEPSILPTNQMKRPNVTYCCSLTGLDMPDAGPEYVLSFAWTHRHNGHEYEHAHTQCTEACFQGKSGRGGPRERNEKKRKLKKKKRSKTKNRNNTTPARTDTDKSRQYTRMFSGGGGGREKTNETKRNETKRNETKRNETKIVRWPSRPVLIPYGTVKAYTVQYIVVLEL